MPTTFEGKTVHHFSGLIDHRVVEIFQLPDRTFQAAENINHTLRFITENCQGLNSFLKRYIGNPINGRPITSTVFELAKKEHETDRRRITGDLYIKHLFFTAYQTDEMTSDKDYSKDERDLLVATSLLHDLIEMKRKSKDTPDYNVGNFINLLKNAKNVDGTTYMKDWQPREIRKLVTMVSLLTPPDKPPDMAIQHWRKVKWEDFRRIINMSSKDVKKSESEIDFQDEESEFTDYEAERIAQMIIDIKVAEIFTNLRETADDVHLGRDGMNDIPDMKHMVDRYKVFKERINFLKIIPMKTNYRLKMDEDLKVLAQLVGDQEFKAI